jgi:hypothetical protein
VAANHGVGNIYRHDYDNVVVEFVWRTVRHSLAPLLVIVEAEMSSAILP